MFWYTVILLMTLLLNIVNHFRKNLLCKGEAKEIFSPGRVRGHSKTIVYKEAVKKDKNPLLPNLNFCQLPPLDPLTNQCDAMCHTREGVGRLQILLHSEKSPARPMLFYCTNYWHQL